MSLKGRGSKLGKVLLQSCSQTFSLRNIVTSEHVKSSQDLPDKYWTFISMFATGRYCDTHRRTTSQQTHSTSCTVSHEQKDRRKLFKNNRTAGARDSFGTGSPWRAINAVRIRCMPQAKDDESLEVRFCFVACTQRTKKSTAQYTRRGPRDPLKSNEKLMAQVQDIAPFLEAEQPCSVSNGR